MKTDNFTFIDLFCGIGGFHQAMSSLGGQCVFACDIDEQCRQTYYDNYGIAPYGDITKIPAQNIPAHDVLCAGFPCQSFSKAGKRLGFNDATKGTLFFDIMRIVNYHKPKYLLLENVRNLASHDNGNTWQVIYTQLSEAGYNLLEKPVIFSPHYIGIPQHRERVFIMCIRKDVGSVKPFVFNEDKVNSCNIDSVLLDDSKILNIKKYKLNKDEIDLIDIWNEFIKNITQPLPSFPIWSDRLCEPDTKEDTSDYPSWKVNFINKNNNLYLDNKKFIDEWLKKAKNTKKFNGAKAKLEWQAGKTPSPDLWDTIMHFRPSGLRVKTGTYFPALVAITQTSIIGKRKRYLTPRECARLQSFPDDFKINTNDIQAYKQFGNAVNVELVRLFANHMFS
ncbi:MAG: DNA cytosine methyltransferase [Bacteroidales bacterium]|nr:DNA cytosine methyltransferase [Bacteroidales bacterium]